jgi:hypothetical protein
MRTLLFISLITIVTSCSQSKKSTDNNPQFYGEFLYLADAAVLNTGTEIYGVIIDEKMHELDDLCVPLKRDDYDMIPVYIKGKVEKKDPNEEGWENLIRITSIDSLVNPTDNTILKPN